MDNVIRPTFGRPVEPAAEAHASADAYQPLRVYGVAAGHLVALVRYDDGPEGPSLQIVVGPEDASFIAPVAVMPRTQEGEVDAEVTAMAILRTLEVVGAGGGTAA